ncbi:MAG TPA: flagellar basal body rod protein FlgC [Vulgatibacter sp.]|nr:flagellar basal body rod protein FlgC [Vulgatibacter sp.]
MDFFSALKVSASGLSAQRTRVNLATSNLANAETTRSPGGGPYKRLDPVFEAVLLDEAGSAQGVRISEIVSDPETGKKVYSPGHPDADENGFVIFPNVEPIHEVVNLLSASRSFEANASAVETLKGMAQRALEIMR